MADDAEMAELSASVRVRVRVRGLPPRGSAIPLGRTTTTDTGANAVTHDDDNDEDDATTTAADVIVAERIEDTFILSFQ